MDYGFMLPHSFPVHGTLMIELTESESLAELDRFVDAMQQITTRSSRCLVVSTARKTTSDQRPHPEYEAVADEWKHAYPRSKAVYPFLMLRKTSSG